MSYVPRYSLNDELIALCHLVKAGNSAQGARAASDFLMQLFEVDYVAFFRLNSAGNSLVLTDARSLGDALFQIPDMQIPIAYNPINNVDPVSQSVITGTDLSIDAPFAGFDLRSLREGLGASDLQNVETLRIEDRQGRLFGIFALMSKTARPAERSRRGLKTLITEAVGVILSDIDEMSNVQKKLADVSEVYAIETKARRELESKIGTQLNQIVGESPPVKRLRRDIARVAMGNSPAFLVGQPGVGRRIVAREIHMNSARANGPFRVLDMKRLTDANIHPELLGYKRGAIDGVASARRGVLADASGGTLYLKDFDQASKNAQELILQVIETGKIRSLGSEMDRTVDVRIIAGIEPEYYYHWQSQDVLPDLFHKLARHVVEVPAITEIREDLRQIISIELERLNHAHHKEMVLSEDAILFLSTQDYSGNLAELRSLIERIHYTSEEGQIISAGEIRDLLNPNLESAPNEMGSGLKDLVKEYERVLISNALRDAEGSRNLAAQKLKLPKRTLAEKCKNFGL